MFRRFFGTAGSASLSVVDALYSGIVAAARQPGFYSAWDVPDTPLGRFEMLSLHIFLFLHRVRNEETLGQAGQEIVDEFFRDVDHSLRELGIGDMAIPKRVKKLARMFYGRVSSYGDALDRDDREALAEALTRNIAPDRQSWEQAGSLASYMLAARDVLAAQPADQLLRGSVRFPSPESSVLERAPA